MQVCAAQVIAEHCGEELTDVFNRASNYMRENLDCEKTVIEDRIFMKSRGKKNRTSSELLVSNFVLMRENIATNATVVIHHHHHHHHHHHQIVGRHITKGKPRPARFAVSADVRCKSPE